MSDHIVATLGQAWMAMTLSYALVSMLEQKSVWGTALSGDELGHQVNNNCPELMVDINVLKLAIKEHCDIMRNVFLYELQYDKADINRGGRSLWDPENRPVNGYFITYRGHCESAAVKSYPYVDLTKDKGRGNKIGTEQLRLNGMSAEERFEKRMKNVKDVFDELLLSKGLLSDCRCMDDVFSNKSTELIPMISKVISMIDMPNFYRRHKHRFEVLCHPHKNIRRM